MVGESSRTCREVDPTQTVRLRVLTFPPWQRLGSSRQMIAKGSEWRPSRSAGPRPPSAFRTRWSAATKVVLPMTLLGRHRNPAHDMPIALFAPRTASPARDRNLERLCWTTWGRPTRPGPGTFVGLIAAVPVARAMGMRGGMTGGGGDPPAWMRHGFPARPPAVVRARPGQRPQPCQPQPRRPPPNGDPYAMLEQSGERRQQTAQIRPAMHRDERRRIGAMPSTRRRERFDRKHDIG